jgi:predicted nucleic acid-binding protein
MTLERITRKVFCDTSFFYASLDKNDYDHVAARAMAGWLKDKSIAIITTWEIVVETVTLLRYRLSFRGAEVFIKNVLPYLNIIYITDNERSKALESFLKLSKDKKLSLCDLISNVVVRMHFSEIPCIAFDDDFRQMGLTVLTAPP